MYFLCLIYNLIYEHHRKCPHTIYLHSFVRELCILVPRLLRNANKGRYVVYVWFSDCSPSLENTFSLHISFPSFLLAICLTYLHFYFPSTRVVQLVLFFLISYVLMALALYHINEQTPKIFRRICLNFSFFKFCIVLAWWP